MAVAVAAVVLGHLEAGLQAGQQHPEEEHLAVRQLLAAEADQEPAADAAGQTLAEGEDDAQAAGQVVEEVPELAAAEAGRLRHLDPTGRLLSSGQTAD